MPCPEKFKESLVKFKINKDIIDRINNGYDDLNSNSKRNEKGLYFQRAIEILNDNESINDLKQLLQYNACCKGGSREKAAKQFYKQNANKTLKEKLLLIPSLPYMGTPILNEDGTITLHAVYYKDNDKYLCACSNFKGYKRDFKVSKNYCYCCGGHFQHHYEIMLGKKIEVLDVVSSPLDSEGKYPCVFRLKIID